MADVKLGQVPTSTISDTSNIIFADGDNIRKETYADVKNNIIGTQTLATTSQEVKGAINEIKGLADSNTASLSDKANLASPNFTGVPTIATKEIATIEKGTFTPTLIGSTVAGANTYSTQLGNYIKIGKLVTFSLRLVLTNKDTNMSGSEVDITGLPFVTSATGSHFSCTVGFVSNINFANATSNGTGAYIRPNSLNIVLNQFIQNASGVVLTPGNITNTTTLFISGSYFID